MSGEIELLTKRVLAYIVGHDAAGLAGRQVAPVAEPDYIVGNWYVGPGVFVSATGGAPGNGSIRAYPFYLKQKCTLNALGVRITTLSAAGNVQAAIYANNAATGRPTGNALASTASMTTGSTGSVNASVSVQLEAGVYWAATNCDNGTATFTALGATSLTGAQLIGSATQGNSLQGGGGFAGVSVAQAFNTWPDLTSGSFTELSAITTVPIVQFKVASVP